MIKTCYNNGQKERLCLIIDKCRRQKLCKRAQKISAAAPLCVMASRYNLCDSPRFLCRPTTLYIIARAVERQSAIYTENSGFASPTLGQHISTFRGYRILFSIGNPYINRFTNHFSIHS